MYAAAAAATAGFYSLLSLMNTPPPPPPYRTVTTNSHNFIRCAVWAHGLVPGHSDSAAAAVGAGGAPPVEDYDYEAGYDYDGNPKTGVSANSTARYCTAVYTVKTSSLLSSLALFYCVTVYTFSSQCFNRIKRKRRRHCKR